VVTIDLGYVRCMENMAVETTTTRIKPAQAGFIPSFYRRDFPSPANLNRTYAKPISVGSLSCAQRTIATMSSSGA
jgi:hypothetical protein